MGKQTPQPPAAPDPAAMATAQGAANKETAITQARLNAVDQVGPYGSVTYTEQTNSPQYDDWGQLIPGSGDGTPKFTQNVTLSPEQQNLYNTQTGVTQKAYDTAGQAIGNVQNTISSPFTLSGLPPLVSNVGTGGWQGGGGQSQGQMRGQPQQQGGGNQPGEVDWTGWKPFDPAPAGYQAPPAGSMRGVLGELPNDPSDQNAFGFGQAARAYQAANGGAQSRQTSQGGGGSGPQAGYDAVGPQFGILPGGQIKGALGDAGGMQRIDPTGQQTDVGYSNPIQNSFGQGGPLAGNVGPTGQAQSLAPSGSIQSGINTQGIQQTPITANDFSQQGQQVQQALMQRFNQDIGRREEDVISRLNAEGIQRGSAGFANAQDDLSRARNDAFGQSVLLGSQEQDRLFNQQLSANQNQFGQRQAMGDFANAAQGQQFGQNLAGGQFQNAALNSLMQQQLAAGQFQNATAGQQYQQNRGTAEFANAAQGQGYGQALSNAQFGNQANQNLFGQQQASQAGNNAAQQQLFAQMLAGGQFQNDAQAQQFSQNAAQQQAYNQAAGQQTANNQGQAAFYNTAQQQGFDQSMQNAGFGNQARQQAIAEQQLMRSQPINEIATLLGLGGGIQVPGGAPNFGVGVGQTDVMGAYGLQQQALQNQYNQQLQSQNAMWGALGNLGGSLGAAAIMSDRRMKNVLRRVGETATGTPLYLYEYKHDPGRQIVGVMAQDVQTLDPEAVTEINGILYVDMARVA